MHLTFVLLIKDCFSPAITARNRIVLQQRYAVLFGCNVKSYIDFSSMGVCSSCEEV